MSHTASVSDHIQTFVSRLEILVDLHFHIIELYFHAVKQCIVVFRTRRDLIQRLDHLDDAVHDTLRQDKA